MKRAFESKYQRHSNRIKVTYRRTVAAAEKRKVICSFLTCINVLLAEQADPHVKVSNELRILPTGSSDEESELLNLKKRIAIKPYHQSDFGETNHLLYPATRECLSFVPKTSIR